MERLKVYSEPSTFWDEVSPFLRTHEAKNSLMLGLAHHFRMDPKNCRYQSALFSDGKLMGALVCSRYMSHSNLVVSPAAPGSIRRLLTAFRRSKISLNGLVGETETVEEYVRLFEKSGDKTRLNVRQGIYRCTQVIPPKQMAGLRFRPASMNDAPTIGKWIEVFHKEAVPHDPPVKGMDAAKPKIERKMIYVLEKDDQLVSMAAWGRDIETSCSINLVFTPKPLRRRGYASAITALLTKMHLDQGKIETNLYTDMGNPTSNKIYREIGYEFVGNSVHLGFL